MTRAPRLVRIIRRGSASVVTWRRAHRPILVQVLPSFAETAGFLATGGRAGPALARTRERKNPAGEATAAAGPPAGGRTGRRNAGKVRR